MILSWLWRSAVERPGIVDEPFHGESSSQLLQQRVEQFNGVGYPVGVTTFLLPSEPVTTLDQYLATETGGAGIERARALGSGGHDRRGAPIGSAGTGRWRVPDRRQVGRDCGEHRGRRFVVCNGAEGEPGTFKDRALIRGNPYQLVEGFVIAAFAVEAEEAFICLKASFERETRRSSRRRSRSSRPPGSAATAPSRSWLGRTSTCSARRRRCSR